jgi:hypothetical protein
MTTEVLRTFWVLDPFQCVLFDAGDDYALHILLRGEAFLMESVRTIADAQARAKALFPVFFSTGDQAPAIGESV